VDAHRHAANLNIFHTLTFDVQWLDTMQAVTDPIPTASASMEIWIEIHIHLGSIAMEVSATMLRGVLTQPFASLYEQLSGDFLVKEFEFGVSH
jgi:hypothetical protein